MMFGKLASIETIYKLNIFLSHILYTNGHDKCFSTLTMLESKSSYVDVVSITNTTE